MILDAIFNEQGAELQADFGNKIELRHIIANSVEISKKYAVSASSENAPTSWSEVAPILASATPYLWMKTLTTYITVDGSAFNFEDGGVVVGVHIKDGVTPEFSIGSVTTLDAGNDAYATITGTKENPVLNLGIPKGAEENVFIGVAGEVTYSQYAEAVAEGKACFMYYENKLYTMSGVGVGGAGRSAYVFCAHNVNSGKLEQVKIVATSNTISHSVIESLTEEQVASAIENYFVENPIEEQIKSYIDDAILGGEW